MGFIEAHMGEPERAQPMVAISEAFASLKQGGTYTLKLIAFCGIILGITYWLEVRFAIENAGFGFLQTGVEALFAYYWHRFVLLGEAEFSGDKYMPFLKRTLLYYLGLVLVGVLFVLVSVQLVDNYSSPLSIGLIGLIVALILLFFPRIALVFPALAVGSSASKMGDALFLSAGNSFRLAGGYLLMTVIIILIMSPSIGAYMLAEEFAPALLVNEAFLLVSNLVLGLSGALCVLVWAGLNSCFYKQLGGLVPDGTEAQDTARAETITGDDLK